MVNRIQPQGRVVDYKTYQITQPKTEKTRIGSCEAADCENYANGWRTVIDMNTDLGKQQQAYIRGCGKRWTEYAEGNGLVTYTFEAGQQCFTQHHVTGPAAVLPGPGRRLEG